MFNRSSTGRGFGDQTSNLGVNMSNSDYIRKPDWDIKKENFGMLYLFSPREMPDVTVRSYQYNLSTDFVDLTNQAIEDSKKFMESSYGGNDFSNINELYLGSSLGHEIVSPTATGNYFRGRAFGEMWSFLMFIDNVPIRGRATNYGMKNRLIYSGFIVDEPCINSQYGGLTLNKNAKFYFTYYTKMNVTDVHARSGSRILARPEITTDIVQSSIMPAFTGGRDILARPSDLISNEAEEMYPSEDDYYPGITGIQLGDNTEYGISVESAYSNPRYHGRIIMNNLVKTVSESEVNRLINNDNNIRNDGLGMRSMRSKFANSLSSKRADRLVGFDTSRPYYLSEILETVPSLEMFPDDCIIIYPDLNFRAEQTTDGVAPNPINIATSLLQQSIPSIVKGCGLSGISFRYTNMIPTYTVDDLNYSFEVLNVSPIISTDTPEIINKRVEECANSMMSQIFNIIETVYGAFDVTVNYETGNNSSISLQLADYHNGVNTDVTVFNDLLSSMLTPVVTSSNIADNNSNFLEDSVSTFESQSYHRSYSHVNNF